MSPSLVAGPVARTPRREGIVRLSTIALAVVLLAGCAGRTPGNGAPAAADLLPADPTLVSGSLPNGLGYVVQRSPNPPGRVAIWLHVATGSLNERDDTRGLAHYLEHMAFNGSANFPPGTVVPFFQSLGLSFGRDQNAFTGFDQTVYILALPDTREATIDRGLLYLSDVAFRLDLQPREIEAERQIILEEKRARSGARQRVQDVVLARLAPESTLGRRLPIGIEDTIRALGPAQFREYYTRWYVPANMTVIAVGDVAPASLVQAITRHFGEPRAGERPSPLPVGVRPTAANRAIVVTDPELTEAEVSLIRVEPRRPPVTTVPAYRRRLVERVGTWIVNRRIETALAEGGVAFLKGDVSIQEWAHSVRLTTAEATSRPDRWQRALADLATALQRARLHGFTAAEVDEASRALRAEVEQGARQEATMPARARLRHINEAVARREPVMSFAQHQALFARLFPGISAEEVSQEFARDFDPDRMVFVLSLPSAGPAPSEEEMVGIGRIALQVRPDPLPERTRAVALLATPPPGGRVVEESRHEATGVWSGWLDNGVRVHYRRVDQRKNEVTVRITLAGGVIQERGDTRGLTEAAVRAWDHPATPRLSSTEIRTLMTGKKVRVGGAPGPDTVTLAVTGDPAALPDGLALVYLLLTEPVVEAAPFEQWRERTVQEIAERTLQPRGIMQEAEADAFYPPAEVRLRPLTAAQVQALRRDDVEAWLHALIAEAPMEVAVVGDIDQAEAVALVARYLGSLPRRARIADTTLSALRGVAPPARPISVARSVGTRTDQAWVLGGFFGADLRNIRDVRLLALASRVLSTRMTRELREERQLVYSIGALSRPAEAYPGFGVFAAQAPTDPTKAEALARALDEMFTAFAGQGPSADELQVAKKQLGNLIDEEMKGPEFWAGRLATLEYRGLSLDDVARLPRDLQSYTADEVREAFARHAGADKRFRFVIVPARLH